MCVGACSAKKHMTKGTLILHLPKEASQMHKLGPVVADNQENYPLQTKSAKMSNSKKSASAEKLDKDDDSLCDIPPLEPVI